MNTKHHLIIIILILFTSLVYNTYEDSNNVESIAYEPIIPYKPIAPYEPIVPYEPVYVLLESIILDGDLFTIVSPSTNYTPVNITDNAHAIDVSYSEVIEFIKRDKTDELLYTDTFRCGEFSRAVHNHAEKYGIKTHMVLIIYTNDSHMINGFNTTDKGMIFIDCTGTSYGNKKYDREVILIEGQRSIGKSIYGGLMWHSDLIERFYII